MVTVRQLTLVAVAAWLGAMGFFAFVVAPAAFSTLGADGSRAVSGPGLREFFNDLAAVPVLSCCGSTPGWQVSRNRSAQLRERGICNGR